MVYLFSKILLCLLLAALVGGIIGWLLRGLGFKSRLAELEGSWRDRLDSANRERDQLSAKHDSLATNFAALEDDHRACRPRIEELEGELEKAGEDQASLSARLKTAENDRQAQKSEIATLSADLETRKGSLGSLETRVSDLEGELGAKAKLAADLEARLSAAQADLEAKATEKGNLATKLEAAEGELTSKAKVAADMESKVAGLESDLDGRTEAAAKLERELEASRARVGTLEKKIAAAESARQSAQAERQAGQETELAKLRRRVSERDETIAGLRRRIEAHEKGPTERSQRDRAATGETRVRATTTSTAASPGGRPNWLLSAPEGEKDDLQRIWGIGPVLERTLNGLGVFHFRQIAGFSQADIAWVAENVQAFPDRIVRDDWVGQAKKLQVEKYGKL